MAIEDFRPTTAQVAAELPDRVKGDNGAPLEDFTDDTWPPAGQVEDQIDQAVRDVALAVGSSLSDPELVEAAKLLATRRAAMLVELRYFRREVQQGLSNYEQLRDEWRDGRDALVRAVEEAAAGGEPGAVDNTVAPSFSFPPASGIGRAGW